MLHLDSEEKRRKAIAWAVSLTADTHLAPEQFELDLLEAYAQGKLTLQKVLERLDTRIQHLLYRSEATQPLNSYQLTELLEQSQEWNQQHGITGLLCYTSEGHFVQVLEGPTQHVHALYARIQQDNRHQSVITLSDKATATRWFADWKMALVETSPQDFFWLIGYLEAKTSNLVKPQVPIADPNLMQLLRQFSEA